MNPTQPANANLVTLQMTPAQSTQKVNATFQVAVNLFGGQDIYSVPMQIQYDASKVRVDQRGRGNIRRAGDGQSVALVASRRCAGAAISASRPPGVSGVTGTGTVCILTFQAKAPGDAQTSPSFDPAPRTVRSRQFRQLDRQQLCMWSNGLRYRQMPRSNEAGVFPWWN